MATDRCCGVYSSAQGTEVAHKTMHRTARVSIQLYFECLFVCGLFNETISNPDCTMTARHMGC
jgi:hypothetical protein